MEETKEKILNENELKHGKHKLLVVLLVILLSVTIIGVVGYGTYHYVTNLSKEPVVEENKTPDVEKSAEETELDAASQDLKDAEELDTTEIDNELKELEKVDLSGV